MATIVNLDREIDKRMLYKEFGDSLSDDNYNDMGKIPTLESDSGWLNPDVEKNIVKVFEQSKERKKSLAPIYDWKTPNKSFIEVHMDLKRLGVKNNKFFLILFDHDLQGVDPFAPVLPLQMQVKIMAEVIRNPWYFLREICRIPEDGKPIVPGGGVKFRLDRNSLAAWYLALNNIDLYLSKPRQRGKTQCALSIIDYIMHFGALSSTIGFSNKDATNNRANLYRLKCQRDLLPTYLQMRMSFDAETGKIIRESNNVTTMRNPVTKNNIQLLPRSQSYDAAITNGRGLTMSVLYMDELDFTPYNNIILQSSAPAYKTAHDNAIANSCMTCRIFTSTPGDLDSKHGASAKEFIDHMVVWDDHMFDEPISKLQQRLTDQRSKRNGVMYVEHTWKQLKCTQKWYEEICRLLNFDQETIMREIDLMRIHGSSLSPFKREDILYLMSRKKNAKDDAVDIIDYGFNDCKIYLYERLKRNVPYIIGIDPSESLGEDNNAMTIISPYTMKIVGEMKSPYISQLNWSKMIVKFMDQFCPRCMIVIENNKGRELINHLLETKYRDRLWYDTKKLMEATEKIKVHGAHTREAFQRRAFGYSTTGASRPLLMSTLETFMEENKNAFISDYVITDICGLVRTATGKIAAGTGNHDDSIMSYLIGVTVFRIADNLEEYGLYRGMTEKGILGIEEPEARSPLEKLKELLPQMPDDLRGMFTDVMRAYDPLSENQRFNQEITSALQKGPGYNDPLSHNKAISELDYSGSEYESYAEQIIAANDFDEDDSENTFNVLDFI